MAENQISLSAARGNLLTWCISGYMPTAELCRPLYFGQQIAPTAPALPEVAPGEFRIIYSEQEARDVFGAGSILANMAIQHFCTCPDLPVYLAPVADPAAGVAAVHDVTITGPALDFGVLSVAIMDMHFAISVMVGATATDIATALAAELQKNVDLPFVVTAAAGKVTFTAKNVGAAGGWFSPIWNPNFGDHFPEGVSATQATTTPGTGLIDIASALPVMACQWDCIGTGFEDELANDALVQSVRMNWRCGAQGNFQGGHLFYGHTDTAGLIAAYGRDRNNPEETIVPVRTGYKYPSYMLVAATTSRVCCTACVDPSRPVQYDNGVLGCMFDSRQCGTIWTSAEKKAFYDAGIMNWDVANSRAIRETALWIEEPLTTYKYDPKTGAPDGAWQRVESRYTTTAFVRALGWWYRTNYSSVSLVSNATRIPAGKRAVSPRILQASILAWLRGTQLGFTAEASPQQLEQMVRVERTNTPNNCDPNRVNVLIDLDLVNQLARIATTINVSPEFACIAPVAAAA